MSLDRDAVVARQFPVRAFATGRIEQLTLDGRIEIICSSAIEVPVNALDQIVVRCRRDVPLLEDAREVSVRGVDDTSSLIDRAIAASLTCCTRSRSLINRASAASS